MKLEKRLTRLNINIGNENLYASDIINRIKGFNELENNWDTYGSEKISPNSISTAVQLIKAFGENKIIIDQAFPMRDGGVQLEKDFQNNNIEIEVNPDNEITLLVFDKESNLLLEKGYNEFKINEIINMVNDNYGNLQHSGKR